MITPLSPAYLIQNALVQNQPLPQSDVNQQIQAQQAQNQVPVTPPVEEARPRPENFGSGQSSLGNQEASAEQSRSEGIPLKNGFERIQQPVLTQAHNSQVKSAEVLVSREVAQSDQTKPASREGRTESTEEGKSRSGESVSFSSRVSGKIKSPYLSHDPVIAGQVVDSVA